MSASPVLPATLAFLPNEAVEKGLVRILEQLSVYAASILTPSPGKLSATVHNTRLLLKRLRAVLWFAQPAFSSSEMRQAKSSLRKASHLLAAQRDLVVTRSILQKLSRQTSNLTYRKALIRLSRPPMARRPCTERPFKPWDKLDPSSTRPSKKWRRA